jgi:hypothetical protein
MGKTWKLLVGFAVVVDKKNAFPVIFVNLEALFTSQVFFFWV